MVVSCGDENRWTGKATQKLAETMNPRSEILNITIIQNMTPRGEKHFAVTFFLSVFPSCYLRALYFLCVHKAIPNLIVLYM